MTETTILAIIGVIGGVGSCFALILKNIKHSDCCYKCFSIDTRTPIENHNNNIISTPPSPQEFKKNKKSKFIREDSITTEISV